MATPQPYAAEAQRLRNITQCSICCEAFREPRILTCFHTFCLICISQEVNERSGENLLCPICRKEFTIPLSGFEGLQKNAFIQRMTEARKLLDRTSGQIPCDTCNDDTTDESSRPTIAISVSNCLECHLNLCEQCCAHHRRSRLTREHALREGANLTNLRESEEAIDLRKCRKHTDEEKKLYCKTCLEVLCPMCFIESHQGHERSSVLDEEDDFRRQIQVSISYIDECTAKAKMKKELIKREMDRITKRNEELQKDIMKRRDELKRLVDEHARLLLEKLDTKVSDKIWETAIQENDNEKHLKSLESYKDYSLLFVAHATNGELSSRAVSELQANAAELRKKNDATVQRQLISIQLSFTATELNKFSNLVENIIGEIEDGNNDELASMSEVRDEVFDSDVPLQRGVIEELLSDDDNGEPEMISKECDIDDIMDTSDITSQPGKKESKKTSVLIKTLKTEKSIPIWGVTALNNELYVVTKERSIIEVFDLKSFSFTRKWNLKKLRDPQDITSCAKEKCLYIIDRHLAMIFKVDPKGILITEWSVYGGGRLSVTHESNVLFTAYKQNRLSEYRADGHLIRDIRLSSGDGIAHPQHAVKLINGNFIVSHGVFPDPLHRVCIVESSGGILKSMGEKAGSTVERLNGPMHLAVDSDGSILVADWNNGRVVMLNSQLKFKKELLSKKNGLRHPGRICLIESNNQLIVADNYSGSSDGQVHIFDI